MTDAEIKNTSLRVQYWMKRIKESETIQEASHVVIDEAQDFGMMIYESLKY